MPLHPLAQRFAAVADSYERGRPEYPPAVTSTLAQELSLAPGARVLDLGAGTGKLTRALLAAGLDVVAVEPQQPLREVLERSVGSGRVRDGTAEAIPMPDASVDVVTAADAFHWFDHRAALAEVARVLRPRGALAVISTVPDWGAASWAHELGELVVGSRPWHPHFDGPSWREALAAASGWAEPREVRLTVTVPAVPERIVDHIASISWIAAMSEQARAELLDRARAVIESGHTPEEMPVHMILGLARLSG